MLRKEQKSEIINNNRTHGTDTGSPAVLEGAVRSGQRAAALLCQGY